jgi:hypothetical protein
MKLCLLFVLSSLVLTAGCSACHKPQPTGDDAAAASTDAAPAASASASPDASVESAADAAAPDPTAAPASSGSAGGPSVTSVVGTYTDEKGQRAVLTQTGSKVTFTRKWGNPHVDRPTTCTLTGAAMSCSWATPECLLPPKCIGNHKEPTAWGTMTRQADGSFTGSWGFGKDKMGPMSLKKN